MGKIGISKIAMVLAVMFMVCASTTAFAASSASVAVKVTITPAISVSITESSVSLGSVNIGDKVVSSSVATITNNGSGIKETYSLSLTNPTGWTASQTAAGTDTYILDAAFSSAVSGITWAEANHALSTTAVLSSTTKFAGDQTGISVPYNTTRKLWFQFIAPTATSVTTEQSINVIVTAQAG